MVNARNQVVAAYDGVRGARANPDDGGAADDRAWGFQNALKAVNPSRLSRRVPAVKPGTTIV